MTSILYFCNVCARTQACTGGWTAEGNAFNELREEFASKGFAILGCSKDGPELNAKFHSEQGFQYPLLCDSEGALYAQFQVSGRATVVVKDGAVIHTLSPFDARTGPANLLEML